VAEESKTQQYIQPYSPPKTHLIPDQEQLKADQDGDEEYTLPQIEYTTVCNADFVPLVSNEFVTSYLEKEGRANLLDRSEAIDLTMNLCYWISK